MRRAVRYSELRRVVERLSTDGHDAALAAATSFALFGMARLGELVSRTAALPWQGSSLPSLSSLKRRVDSVDSPARYELKLAFDKVKKGAGSIVTVSQRLSCPIDPVALMDHHLVRNNIKEGEHLFSYNNRRGQRRALSKKALMEAFNQHLAVLGFEGAQGHSFRGGGCTFYLLAGMAPDFVRNIGRWQSTGSFDKYWRDMKEIAASQLATANTGPGMELATGW